jgi:selenocysteine lyase/cysteine desulfurase
MNIHTFREGMRVVDKYCYLNHASNGPLHELVVKELHNVANSQINGDVDVSWDIITEGFKEIRYPISKLIHSQENEIALTSTTSHGIALILESLDWSEPSKCGIIIDDLEFTSNSFAYQQIQKKFGVKLHVIKNKSGMLDLTDYEQILNEEQIKLVGVSHVQFTNGFKINIEKLHELTRKNESLLMVDAIQSCGSIDIKSSDTDFMAVGSYKWCLGPFATGFVFINNEIQKDLEPIFVSALSDKNILDFVHHEFHPYDDAKKFQSIFNPNFLAMGKSIEILNSVGLPTIENQIYKLTDYLTERLSQIPGIVVESYRSDENRSGIVKASSNNPIELQEIVKRMKEKYNIVISFRNNGLRISPHFYNTFEEIDHFISTLKTLMNTM